jgi:hypothetical protein
MSDDEVDVSIAGSFRTLGRGQVISLASIFGTFFLLLPFLGWWFLRSNEVRSSAVARYGEFLHQFPSEMVRAVPRAIPPHAQRVSLDYVNTGDWMGPPGLLLKVTFAIPQREAAELIREARTALAGKTLQWDAPNRIRYEFDGRNLDIQTNLSTGEVSIDLESS